MSASAFLETNNKNVHPLYVLQHEHFADWCAQQPNAIVAWLEAQHFTAAAGTSILLPGENGIGGAVLGIAEADNPWSYAHAPSALPADSAWKVANQLSHDAHAALQLGWGLGAYRFDRYKKTTRQPARLQLTSPDARSTDLLAACCRVRDLVNTPTEDMGPAELETVVRQIGNAHKADVEMISGAALLEHNFPAIHAVGRASHRPPRLIALRWGAPDAPKVSLVGKGVCFDTGGLDIKPSGSMRNMKKDMGGAAHAIALAELIMQQGLPVRLTLLVPAVENAVGPDAFRPGEVIQTRTGLSVEIDNTDAEGRLILGDALAYASEDAPDVLLDFATLTGAARVAVGPDLPVLFSNNDALANAWLDAGERTYDPLWRLPLWRPYLRYLSSTVADLANAGSRMAGAVTAALYLERFVLSSTAWAHLDVYAWNDGARPGRPVGGEAMALRAAFEMLYTRYGS